MSQPVSTRVPEWRKILAATDYSPLAQRAVSHAHDLAERLGAELHVLNVVPDVAELGNAPEGVIDPSDGIDERESMLAALLGDSATIKRVQTVRVNEDPAQAIAEYAAEQEIDLVVIATHGRTGLAHLFLGSVAENVLRLAPCPVMIVRATITP